MRSIARALGLPTTPRHVPTSSSLLSAYVADCPESAGHLSLEAPIMSNSMRPHRFRVIHGYQQRASL